MTKEKFVLNVWVQKLNVSGMPIVLIRLPKYLAIEENYQQAHL